MEPVVISQFSMTVRMERFVEEAMLTPNDLGGAYKRAGFTGKKPKAQALRLMRHPGVQEAIRGHAERLERRTKFDVSLKRVVEEIARIAFANPLDYMRITSDGDPMVYLGELTRDQAAAIKKISVEDYKDGRGDDARDVRKIQVEFHDKLGALVTLGKHVGLRSMPEPEKQDALVVHITMNMPSAPGEDRSYRDAPAIEHQPQP